MANMVRPSASGMPRGAIGKSSRRASNRPRAEMARFEAGPAPSSKGPGARLGAVQLGGDSQKASSTGASKDSSAYNPATGMWECQRGCGYACDKRQGLGGHKRRCPLWLGGDVGSGAEEMAVEEVQAE